MILRNARIALGVMALMLISRIWDLRLARTPCDEESARQIVLALQDLGREALDWGRRHNEPRTATIHYHLQPDRATLTIRDEADGQFLGQPLRPEPSNRFRGSRLDVGTRRVVRPFNLPGLVAPGRVLVIDYSQMEDQSYAVLLSYFLR